jgi:hypothetical protein
LRDLRAGVALRRTVGIAGVPSARDCGVSVPGRGTSRLPCARERAERISRGDIDLWPSVSCALPVHDTRPRPGRRESGDGFERAAHGGDDARDVTLAHLDPEREPHQTLAHVVRDLHRPVHAPIVKPGR